MAGKIFINYRRENSIGMAGRLHDRLERTFGRANLFMDVDHIPAGIDFVAHLNREVAACDVILVLIGPNWLTVKNESGGRRLDDPEDFVAIEIAAALARDIRVIPVLVDGARVPKASELPDSLKPLARRHAVDIRHTHFGHDAEALVARMREALGNHAVEPRRWRVRAAIGAAVAVLLLLGWGGYVIIQHRLTRVEGTVPQLAAAPKAEQQPDAKEAAQAEEKRKALQAEQQRAEADSRRDAEEKRLRAEAEARPDPALALEPGSGKSFRDLLMDGQPCPACPEMVVVPAGDVMMGSPEQERGRSDEEGPQHRVTIANPFAIGKFSVTRGEFAAFVGETGYNTLGGCDVLSGSEWKHLPDRSWRSPGSFDQNDRHPVVCVNWYDAKAYAAWLSKKVGKEYRLLTEAEREYAARAKTATRYSFGDDAALLSQYAWYEANAGGATHPVDEKKPNAFGLHDMHGNVWSWCEDIWHSSYHGAPNDGSAWQTGDTSFRVVRGGSWYRKADGLRSAFRNTFSPDGRFNDVGFRVARGL